MGNTGDSSDTGMLELQSLQLDVQTLQKHREEDMVEFLALSETVKKNIASIQKNFISIQSNFERLFADRNTEEGEDSLVGNSSSHPHTPPNPVHMSAPSVQQQQKTVGNATLQDNQGKELNLDGTPKAPYRHPNFGHAQPIVENRDSLPLQLVNQEIQNMAISDMGNNEEGDRQGIHQRNRALFQQNDTRRNSPAVKLAKMNIPEFDGMDADS